MISRPYWKVARPFAAQVISKTPAACGVHKLDFADDQGSCTPIGIECHHWCYRVSTLVPWLGSDGSADASSLARGPDDVFGTHRAERADVAVLVAMTAIVPLLSRRATLA